MKVNGKTTKHPTFSVDHQAPLVWGIHRTRGVGLTVLTLCVLGLSSALWGDEAEKSHPQRTMTAVRVNPHPPEIDGILDDEAWQDAPIATEFVLICYEVRVG
ncbi:MAG: hypothetical protein O7E52_16520 [Candidatus Poribacteria bacterium]|nr:hypothetical protein [Candidatus Poribacteria bacterium]